MRTDAVTIDAATPDAVEPDAANDGAVEPGAGEPDAAGPGTVEPDAVEPGTVELDAAKPKTVEPDAAGPDTANSRAVAAGAVVPGRMTTVGAVRTRAAADAPSSPPSVRAGGGPGRLGTPRGDRERRR
jgi:hypothetical protein